MALAQSQHEGAQRSSFKEFDNVTLLVPVASMGFQVPVGTEGTIVDIHPDGQYFEIEFFEPHPCVATLHFSQVA